MPISNRSFVQSTVVLLVVGLLTLIGIVATTYWLVERAQVYFDQVVAARDARGTAVELRSAVQTAESSQRGFLVAGSEIYLSPYEVAKTQALRQLDILKVRFAAFPQTTAPLERLTAVLAEKFDEMDKTIAMKRDGRETEVSAIVQTNRGKALMDEANVFFSGLIRVADERLANSIVEHRDNASWLSLVALVGGGIIILVVGAAAYAVFRYTRELAEARDEVGALNAGLETRVKERTADLARANDEIQRFAYIITHDLRAPLVNIMGFTSELESSAKSLQALVGTSEAAGTPVMEEARIAAEEDLPEAISFIRTSTRKMDNLINAILKLSREGRRPLRPEPLDLRDLLEACAASIQHQLVDADGSVDISGPMPRIVGDRFSLEQVFGNMFDNAVKYRSKTRPLRIGLSAAVVPGDRIGIDISDNGRGIADQDLERVFELFRRAGTQDQPGEGIGLAFVRTLVRNMGGEISVSSRLDEGTTFRIVLPRVLRVPERSVP